MLKNIDPILGPQLLSILRSMGHGEEIAIVDRNYPALSAGPTLIRHDGSNAPRTLDAVLSVLPLDNSADAMVRMEVRNAPQNLLPVMRDLIDIAGRHALGKEVASLQPSQFKSRAASAVAIIVTGEERVYGNILLRKGTLGA